MNLSYYVSVLVKWGWLVLLATALAAGLSYRSAARIPRVYQATATLLVGRTLQTTNPNPDDLQTSQTLAKSYAQLARSQPVLQGTVDTLHLNVPWAVLASEVQAMNLEGTETIAIDVVDPDPRRAMLIANEVAHQLILQSPTPQQGDPQRDFANQQMAQLEAQIKDAQGQIAALKKQADQETSARALQDLQNQMSVLQQHVDTWQATYAKLSDFYQGSRTNYLSVLEPATIPAAPVGTSLRYNVGLAGGIGFALGVAGVVLIELLDDTFKTQKEVTALLQRPIVGGVGRQRRADEPAGHLFVVKAPRSAAAEAFRFLATNVHPAGATNEAKTFLVTSPGPAEGASTVAANLGLALAQTGKRVILVDANLRRPSLHRRFGLHNQSGLSTLLTDESCAIEGVLQTTMIPDLRVVPSGPLPMNPGDLLGSSALRRRMAQLRDVADVVIVDSAAILGAADTTMVGKVCERILLVVAIGRTRRAAAAQARDLMGKCGLEIQGVVLNGLEVGRTSYQSYYTISATAAVPDGGPKCPFLGLRKDPSTVLLAVNGEHRCRVSGQPKSISFGHQQEFCLSAQHQRCPLLLQARGDAPAATSDPRREGRVDKPPALA